jgi:LemA protein
MLGLLIFIAILAAVAFWGVGIYNGLVRARNAFKNAFAQIDVQLQRRFDLIPNLVETAKAYMSHERETLEAVIAARSAAQSGLAAAKANPGDAEAMAQLAAAQGQLNAGLGRLMMAMAEAYPDLKANQNMMQLTEELTSTENKVALRTAGVQRRGDGLQQQARGVPVQHDRRHVQFRRRQPAGDPGGQGSRTCARRLK